MSNSIIFLLNHFTEMMPPAPPPSVIGCVSFWKLTKRLIEPSLLTPLCVWCSSLVTRQEPVPGQQRWLLPALLPHLGELAQLFLHPGLQPAQRPHVLRGCVLSLPLPCHAASLQSHEKGSCRTGCGYIRGGGGGGHPGGVLF